METIKLEYEKGYRYWHKTLTQGSIARIQEKITETYGEKFSRAVRVTGYGIECNTSPKELGRQNYGTITKISSPLNELDFEKLRAKYDEMYKIFCEHQDLYALREKKEEATRIFMNNLELDNLRKTTIYFDDLQYSEFYFDFSELRLITNDNGEIVDISLTKNIELSPRSIDRQIELLQRFKKAVDEARDKLIGKNIFDN